MATGIHRLSAIKVQRAKDGDYADGGGLLLRIVNGNGSWCFRYTSPAGKRRELGLGKLARNDLAAAGKSLTGARDAAEEARRLLRSAIDPIDHRNAQREQARKALQIQADESNMAKATLARVARKYHETAIASKKSAKHGRQWLASLENHVPAGIWHKPIAEVTDIELFDFLLPLFDKVPETASRIRQRLDAIFDDAVFRKLCTANPAQAIRRRLGKAVGDRQRGNHAALPYAEAPAFMVRLRERQGVSARALEFAMLTAARTGEVVGATWSEFNLDAGTWVIPGSRMKGKEQHVVYLPPRAIEIVKTMQELQQPYVFPSPDLDGKPLSNMAQLALLRRLDADKVTTVHGLCRATFSTWANETGAGRSDVVEACLAHKEADRVKAAYNRAQFNEERAALLRAWADYLDGREPASNVVPIKSTTAA